MKIQSLFWQYRTKVITLLLLVGLQACGPEVEEIVDSNGGLALKITGMGIDKAEVVEWPLGKKKNSVISKGIRVSLALPELPTDLAKDLYKKGANAWVIKSVKTQLSGDDILEYGFLPFIIETEGGSVSASKIRRHFLQISYSGVRVPKRFEEYNCPLYGHKKIVTDHEVQKNWQDVSVMSIRQGRRITSKLHKASLEPQTLDAGNSILGTYRFYIALINSHTKDFMSNYIPFEDKLIVKSEEEGDLGEECLNFNPNSIRQVIDPNAGKGTRPFGL